MRHHDNRRPALLDCPGLTGSSSPAAAPATSLVKAHSKARARLFSAVGGEINAINLSVEDNEEHWRHVEEAYDSVVAAMIKEESLAMNFCAAIPTTLNPDTIKASVTSLMSVFGRGASKS